jgi:hypothetical protein
MKYEAIKMKINNCPRILLKNKEVVSEYLEDSIISTLLETWRKYSFLLILGRSSSLGKP